MYVNEQIKASKIMIIDEDGKNMGTFPRDVALQIASDQ
jgi:translation initiation factor IF-3